jgi:hypothetical protein
MMKWLPQSYVSLGAAVVTTFCSGAGAASADTIDGVVNPASNIRVTTAQLTFSGLGAASAKTFMVIKHGYTRTFNAASRTCGQGDRAIARFTPDAHAGPAATFTVTPLNPGYCTITVADDGSGAVRVQVDVQTAGAAPRPSSSPAAR